MEGFVSCRQKPLVVTSPTNLGGERDTTYDYYVDYLDPIPENNKIKNHNMDNYEGVRQPLDAKPPHLEKNNVNYFINIKDLEAFRRAAAPRIEGIEGDQVIVSSTPEGDNFYYDLWNKVNEDDANIPDYLKEWINLIKLQRQQEQSSSSKLTQY